MQISDDAFDGELKGAGKRVAIVVARFNSVITRSLLAAACQALADHGVADTDVDVHWVPGAWELPGTCARVLDQGRQDAVIALGCVIRGGTPHFEYVAGEAARGLQSLAIAARVPVIFGVLTTDDRAQAEARAGGSEGNKGTDVALAALEMIDVYQAVGQ